MNEPDNPQQTISVTASKVAKNVEVAWPELATSSRYVRRTGWAHRATPEELSKYPDDVVIPEKLQQILTWSLIPGNNWSYEVPKREEKSLAPDTELNGLVVEPETADDDHKNPLQTPSLNVETASISSYSTSLTRPVSGTQDLSVGSDKSLKTRFLLKMRLKKSSERLQTSIAVAVPATAECTSCFDDLPESQMTRLDSCRHWYCKDCLSALITTAMAAEASFPPKCCLSPIPLQQILRALTPQQREDYQLKAAEYNVPATERWYCPNKDCLKWIPALQLKMNKELGYDCPHCAAKLCRICRGPAHPTSTECPQDFGLEATLETAEIEGWQRCYKCRALVEHNKGCRHMTCRCRAQFCYVCGLRWQTCSCTETDAANKRAGAERRRQDKLAKVDTEAAEIARAIAEVEEMERREAEERRLEDERREREEERQLLALEAMRLEEESQRQEAAAQAERDLRDVLLRSFEEEWQQMEQIYLKISTYQSELLNSKHTVEDLRLRDRHIEDKEQVRLEFSRLSDLLAQNSRRRRGRLVKNQKKIEEALRNRQEEDEDDLFLQLQLRLRGKTNKESRMEKMLSEIHRQQEDERNELAEKQQAESKDLETKVQVDTEGLGRWFDTRIQDANCTQVTALQKFGFTVGADRQYFDVVAERRRVMISLHGQACLQSLYSGEELTGLTEFAASKVGPYLPELDDGEPGPSGIKRGPEIIKTTHGPLVIANHTAQSSIHLQNQTNETVAPLHESRDLSADQKTSVQQRQSVARPYFPGSFPPDVNTFEPAQSTGHAPKSLLLPPLPLALRLDIQKPHQTTDRTQFDVAPLTTQSQLTPTPMTNPALAKGAIATAGITFGVIPNLHTNGTTTTMTFQEQAQMQTQAQALVVKKSSKWGFKKTKGISEDEMKRRLRASVGDAF